VYWTAQIVLFGAAVTHTISDYAVAGSTRGQPQREARHAV
jgi:uncharacterized BrkB/YihY/UPF0761 family membrane protein